MNQLSLNWPSSLLDPDAYTNALQQAFQQIQSTVNNNATQPQVLAFVQSFTDSNNYSTASGSFVQIPNWKWTFTSQGGLVCISASIQAFYNNSNNGTVALFIDGKNVLQGTAHTAPGGTVSNLAFLGFDWKSILGTGQHTVEFMFMSGAGTFQINPVSFPSSSSASIIEFPANVQAVNVATA